MINTTTIADGIYFIHADGCAWQAAEFRRGQLVDHTEASLADTHAAANDRWAGIVPSDSDIEANDDLAAAIIHTLMGSDVDTDGIIVTFPAVWVLEMRDDCGSSESVEFDHQPPSSEITAAIKEWVAEGSWGDDGASVDVRYDVTDPEGDEVDSDCYTVEIEPDHDAMIRAAGGDTDCEHDWTSDGEGGLDENPGVWSTGGTSMTFASHCRCCGLHRIEHATGSQKNPGEHDTVEYSQPDAWCAECQSEDCTCESGE